MAAILNVRILVIATIMVAAFAMFGVQAFAKEHGGSRPGWGFGDKNHTHTGPPGQSVRPPGESVRPDDNDDQGEDEDHQGNQNNGNHGNNGHHGDNDDQGEDD